MRTPAELADELEAYAKWSVTRGAGNELYALYQVLKEAAQALRAIAEPEIVAALKEACHERYDYNPRIGDWEACHGGMWMPWLSIARLLFPELADTPPAKYEPIDDELARLRQAIAEPDEATAYQREVVEPNREVYGADVEAARNSLKRYRKGMWHINGAIVRESLDAAYEAVAADDEAVDAMYRAIAEYDIPNNLPPPSPDALRVGLTAALASRRVR
jgi:hypothetical protein